MIFEVRQIIKKLLDLLESFVESWEEMFLRVLESLQFHILHLVFIICYIISRYLDTFQWISHVLCFHSMCSSRNSRSIM